MVPTAGVTARASDRGYTWLTRLRIGTHNTTCRGVTSRGPQTTTTAKMTTQSAPQQEGHSSTAHLSFTGKNPLTVLVVDTRTQRALTNEVAVPTAADDESWTGKRDAGPSSPPARPEHRKKARFHDLGLLHGAGGENRTRALSLGSCGHLQSVWALTWATIGMLLHRARLLSP